PCAVLPGGHVSGRERRNSIDHRPGRRNMAELKINVKRLRIHSPLDQARGKQALQLRSKNQAVIWPRKIEWLDTQAIPRQQKLACPRIPDRQSKHSAHFLDTAIAIFLIEV